MRAPFFVTLFLVSLLCICTGARHATAARHIDYKPEDLSSDARLLMLFNKWMLLHRKNYTFADGNSEKQSRFKTFKNNLFYIHNHNTNKDSKHKLGLNHFADLTLAEFKAKYLPSIIQNDVQSSTDDLAQLSTDQAPLCVTNGLPTSVDWRLEDAVTPVKDQGQCGSCWAFSSTGAMEGAYAIATGKLVSLSEQELVSCVLENFGCDGGWMDPSFDWVVKNGGINTEDNYPYVSAQGNITTTCNSVLSRRNNVTIDGYKDVKHNDEEALICAVARQPVSVVLNAGTSNFMLYMDGIFSGNCSDDPNDIDHAMLVVGYGSDNGTDYWIFKNSWSEKWGKDGYMLLERSTGDQRGVCGIHAYPSYPVVKTR